MLEILPVLLFLFFSIALTIASKKKNSLDNKGIIFANITGLASFLIGGITPFLVLIFLFVTTEITTRIARKKNKEKHETRSYQNVLGNTGPAVLFLALNHQIGFYSSIASALADTCSSEIGLTSKQKPVLITNLKKVEPGTNGGITLLGSIAAITGSFLIAIIFFFFTQKTIETVIVFLTGMLGSFIDSLLGATIEGKKIGNNTVNFTSNLIAGATAITLKSYFA